MNPCFAAIFLLISFLSAHAGFCEPLEAYVSNARKEQTKNQRSNYFENKIIYAGSHDDTPITVEISCKSFDQNAHNLLPISAAEGSWSCDGVLIRGADGLPPQGYPQLSKVAVKFGKKIILVPNKYINHLFNPNSQLAAFNLDGVACNQVQVDTSGKFLSLYLGLGDGAVATQVNFEIHDDGCIITDDPEFLQDYVFYKGSINGQKIQISASVIPFAQELHKCVAHSFDGAGESCTIIPATVNGRKILGSSGELPENGRPCLGSLNVQIGEKIISLKTEDLVHIISPNIKKGCEVTLSADGKGVEIRISADHTDKTSIIVTKDGNYDFVSTWYPGP